MSRWLKVTVHSHQNGGEHRCELIDRTDIKRVVDQGDFRTIVFSYARIFLSNRLTKRDAYNVSTILPRQVKNTKTLYHCKKLQTTALNRHE